MTTIPKIINATEFAENLRERFCGEHCRWHRLLCKDCWVTDFVSEIEDAPTVGAEDLQLFFIHSCCPGCKYRKPGEVCNRSDCNVWQIVRSLPYIFEEADAKKIFGGDTDG